MTALHSYLEVPYEASFLSSLCSAAPGDAIFALVAEYDGGAVAVLSARVEWSARGLLSWLGGAASAAAGALVRLARGGSGGGGDSAASGAGDASGSGGAARGGHPGYVLTLAVSPAHRGRGLAAALLSRAVVVELAAARGCDEVSLHCLASNATARRLYARAGFVQEALLPGYYAFDGREHDGVLLVRRLTGSGSGGSSASAVTLSGARAPLQPSPNACESLTRGACAQTSIAASGGDVETAAAPAAAEHEAVAAAPAHIYEAPPAAIIVDEDAVSRGVWALLFSSLRMWWS